MNRAFRSLGIFVLCVFPTSLFAEVQEKQDDQEEQKGRPALALKFDLQGDVAEVTIALNHLMKPEDAPTFLGVRFYQYGVRVGSGPQQIGWQPREKDRDRGLMAPPALLLNGTKYHYNVAHVDRQEGGSLQVTRVKDSPDLYHIEGVYSYSEQLFIIDANLAPGKSLSLVERLKTP
jgi:hypothetical protein